MGVLVGTRFIFSGVELSASEVAAMQAAGTYAAYLYREILRVVTPFLVLAAIVLVWAAMIAFTRLPAFITQREHAAEARSDWRALLREPHFLLALSAQFLYVGAQVGTWSYFIQYTQEYARTPVRLNAPPALCSPAPWAPFSSAVFFRPGSCSDSCPAA